VPAGSLAPESSEKSLSSIISEFISNTIRARRGYRFVSYGSIALIVMLSVGVYSVIPTLPPEQPTLPSPNDYGIITRGGAPTQLTEQVIEEIDINDLIKEPKTALPKEDIQPVEELVEKSPVEPSKDNVTLEGKWEGTKTVSIEPEEAFSEMITEEPEIAELTPPEAEETIGVLETKHKDASGKTIHKVKPNDSLFSISKKYFGDEAKWHKIYEVNRDNMSGPNALYIGQELVIPEITLAKRVTLPEDEVSLGLSMHIISHGKDTDGSVSEVTIEEGSILRSKDKFKVQFETKEDAYVYIIIHDSLNKANLLFPDPRITLSNNVKANTSHTVPTSEHWFWLDENVGIETVYVLASETPLDNIKALLLAMEDVVEPKQQIMEFVKDKATELRAISFRHQ
jgi:LysM repeat protein